MLNRKLASNIIDLYKFRFDELKINHVSTLKNAILNVSTVEECIKLFKLIDIFTSNNPTLCMKDDLFSLESKLFEIATKNKSKNRAYSYDLSNSNEKSHYTDILIISPSISDKILRYADCLKEKFGIYCNIILFNNFTLNKPYSCKSKVWYPSEKKENVRFDNDIVLIDIVQTEDELIKACKYKFSRSLVFTMGCGKFSRDVIDIFKNGIINIHNGFLPYFRGLDSPGWSFLLSEPFGVSAHKINCEFDLGSLVCSRQVETGRKMEFSNVTSSIMIDITKVTIIEKKTLLTKEINGGSYYPPLGDLAIDFLERKHEDIFIGRH
ncbi:formyltransferase family protein [Vibrio campbellii]|uniref:formyltransferase family protein n=2 Tax=Vibrio campbellii TaxID=680 RepID=UPI000575FDF8|nr:formyltransferase family protein [Vibrio campbellii]ARV71342.1 hypothetical protein A8140_00880 [Vibrio campbellii CAIM 519 = NBRC 15631 = ATCC 25920]